MYKIAIVGAGPAGLAMGAELVQSGVPNDQIIILEKSEHDNASIRQFYPVGKDINSVYKNIEVEQKGVVGFSGIISLDQYHDMIAKIIFENKLAIITKTEVQKIVQKPQGFHIETSEGVYEAEFVVLSSGVFAKPRKPDYPISAPLNAKVSYDILKLQKDKVSGKDMLVVGGGDSASEYVQMLSQMGNKLTLSYRQDKIFRMNQLNLDKLDTLTKNKEIDMCLGTNITSLEAENDKIRVHLEERDDLVVDYIVYSLGGASPTAFMAQCGLEYDDTNVVLRDNHQTSVDKLYMIGDLASGRKGGSIMLAFNGAREVMESLHKNYQFPQAH